MGVNNFKDLLAHAGHELECVYYGDKDDPSNVAIECVECNEVLLDFDSNSESEEEEEQEYNPLLKPIADQLIGVYFKAERTLKLFHKVIDSYKFLAEYNIAESEEADYWDAINITDVHSPFQNTPVNFFGATIEELDVNFGYGEEYGTFLSIYPVANGSTLTEFLYPVQLKVLEADDPCYYIRISDTHPSKVISDTYGQCVVPLDKAASMAELKICPGFSNCADDDGAPAECEHCWIENWKGHCQLWLDLERVERSIEGGIVEKVQS